MKLSILTQLEYYLPETTDLLLQLEAAMIPEQPVEHAHIDLPPAEHFARLPGHDEIGDRIWLRLQGTLNVRYEARVSVERITSDIAALRKVPPHLLPAETIEYLMPSRYCASDEFQALVEADFGRFEGGERIVAMRDWIKDKIRYAPGSSNSATDALQTYVSRCGVCRDFAHVLICMARASAIPARFASVYGLGVEPQDFHAVAEVFLDGAWHLVDATGMAKSEEMAKIGVGRDAADVSFLTSYGDAFMQSQSIRVSAI
ncbi:MAG: transglutaminase family protein [Sphingomonadaceae bacterium]|jgi:transglutaminase-like putative cysteine protease